MKKTIICSVPMKEFVEPTMYTREDCSIKASDRLVRFPINAILEKTITPLDGLKVILLIKEDEFSFCEKHLSEFKEEINQVLSTTGVSPSFVVINTEFSQKKIVHEQLMGKLVDEIEEGTHILVDITYGPKDLPIVIFAALGFAEKFLDCEIDNIIYGQASFNHEKVVKTKICDMSPLYYLSSVTNTIRCENPQKARDALKILLSF